jgi:hypothetical protein
MLRFAQLKWIFLVVLAGLVVMLPAYVGGVSQGADLTNHFVFAQPLYEEIGKGNLVPGWLGESNFGFGDPRVRFYPPFLYYVLCLFRLLTGDWFYAMLGAATLFSVVGALGVYFWARLYLSNEQAFLAALIFTLTPYHFAQFYQASLLAEFAAMSLLPFAFLAVDRLLSGERNNLVSVAAKIASLAAVYSLIVTTHVPTTVIGSLTLGIFALFITKWSAYKKGLVFCALGILLGLASSSWFWVKMISELSWIQAGVGVSSSYYDYRNNFVFSPFAPANLNTFYASLVAALTVSLLLPSFIIWKRILLKKEYGNVVRVILVLAIGTFFMTTDLSRPVWAIVPKLKDVQFPYRWLALTSVLICPIVALSYPVWIEYFQQKKFRPLHLALLLFFAGGLIFSVWDLVIDADYISRDTFIQKISNARGGPSFKDWLPRDAMQLSELRPMQGNVESQSRQVSIVEWESHRRVFNVSEGPEGSVRLRSYYYPLWVANRVEGGEKSPLELRKGDDGTLLAMIPKEAVTVELSFVEPFRTKASQIISLLGWTLTLALMIIGCTQLNLRSQNSE